MIIRNSKKKLAIFDLTDCEGCQIELISLGKRLLDLLPEVEIVNWRLGQKKVKSDSYDIALVEGSPLTQEEIDLLKGIREKSKILLALGTCASTGGVPAILDKEKRQFWYQKIYGPEYKPRGIDALPLSVFIKVDFSIFGCPVNGEEVLKILMDILWEKSPKMRSYSVCFECKTKENPCFLINKKPCLGPIIQAGCGAICPSANSSCYGCFGFRKEANIDGLLKILREFCSAEEIEQYFSMFLKTTEEYKKYIKSEGYV